MTVIPARTDTDQLIPVGNTSDEPGLDHAALPPPPEPPRSALDTADPGLDQPWLPPTDDDDHPLAY